MSEPTSPHLRPLRTTNRSDPAIVSASTPPVVNKGANDTAAQVEYVRSREQRLRKLTR